MKQQNTHRVISGAQCRIQSQLLALSVQEFQASYFKLSTKHTQLCHGSRLSRYLMAFRQQFK